MTKTYLNESSIDDLARMFTALLSEVWIMRDRMAIMEKLLADRGGLQPGEIDDYVPDEAFAAEIEVLRDRLVGNVVTAPIAAQERSVEAILTRAGMADAAAKLAARSAT